MRPLVVLVRWGLAAAAGYACVWGYSDSDPAWAKAPRGEARAALIAEARRAEEQKLDNIVAVMPASDRVAPPFEGLVLSTVALELVREAEPLRLEPAPRAAGGWTIGYGHVVDERPMRAFTREEAEALLREDLSDAEDAVRQSIHAPLNDNEYAALVEFALSIGPDDFGYSLVAMLVNGGDREAAADAFLLWDKVEVDGVLLQSPELVARRRRTKSLFLSGSDAPGS